MKKLSNQQLKAAAIIITALSVIVGLVLWLFMPATFQNTGFFHVGTGDVGSKYGALIFLPLPFLVYLKDYGAEEIHTEDPEEKIRLEEKRDRKKLETRVIMAIAMAIVIWSLLGFAVAFL